MKNVILLLPALMLLTSGCASKFVVSTRDENLSALTKVTDADQPCITPFGGDDGQDLFYAGCEKGKYYNIYRKANAFSNSSAQLTTGDNYNYAPSYSKILNKLAFRCHNDGNRTSDIYLMNPSSGKAMTQLTESGDAYESNPDFSSDGKWVVYDKQMVSSISKGLRSSTIVEKSEIWLQNLETGESILLGRGYQPSFSPDDSTILYVKYSPEGKSCDIWTMDIEGGSQTRITDTKKGYAHDPRWSPDGSKIVFALIKKDKRDSDIYVIDKNGQNLSQLTKNKSNDSQPYWTNDGYIYFTSDRGSSKGKYQIWRFKVRF